MSYYYTGFKKYYSVFKDCNAFPRTTYSVFKDCNTFSRTIIIRVSRTTIPFSRSAICFKDYNTPDLDPDLIIPMNFFLKKLILKKFNR